MNIFSILTNFEDLAPIWLHGTLDLAPRCSSVLATLRCTSQWPPWREKGRTGCRSAAAAAAYPAIDDYPPVAG